MTTSVASPPVFQTRSLPSPRLRSDVSLEEAIAQRESTRAFDPQLLRAQEISQLLWAGQGITRGWGARAAPSAGALYPLELYVVTPDGMFHYLPQGHALLLVHDRDLRRPLAHAAFGQSAVEQAPAIVVVTALYTRSRPRYGARAVRYAALEAGHVVQNLLLQAVALGLVAVPLGAFDDDGVRAVLDLSRRLAPLYLVAVGHPVVRS
jgi:SagB-type dehydrogenase family enzyme